MAQQVDVGEGDMKKSVITRIGGGLGNQMFNFAVGEAIAVRTGRRHLIDLAEFHVVRSRRYGLDSFVGPHAVARPTVLVRALLLAARIVQRFSHCCETAILRAFGIRHIYASNAFAFEEEFAIALGSTARTLYVTGCYGLLPFLPSREELRRMFAFAAPANERNAAYLAQIKTVGDAVSLHIRRSDYLWASNGCPALDESWYRAAIAEMSRCIASPRWFVFSDDVEWCRKTFADLPDATFVEGNDETPAEDLRLMSACRHHVIANSTFSWWGAYLGADGGTTICPAQWFKGLPTRPGVMVPEDWILV